MIIVEGFLGLLEIAKYLGIGIAILFGIGCVLAFLLGVYFLITIY